MSETVTTTIIATVAASAISSYVSINYNTRKNRKTYSGYGLAVTEALLEEARNCLGWLKNEQNLSAPPEYLPSWRAWSGMSTISDEVLERIRAIDLPATNVSGFYPKDVRSHCKNFFENMPTTYIARVEKARIRYSKGEDWMAELLYVKNGFTEPTIGVIEMLESIHDGLRKNQKRWWPR